MRVKSGHTRFDAYGGVFIGVRITNVGFTYRCLVCVIIGFYKSTSVVLSTSLIEFLWTSSDVIASFIPLYVALFHHAG